MFSAFLILPDCRNTATDRRRHNAVTARPRFQIARRAGGWSARSAAPSWRTGRGCCAGTACQDLGCVPGAGLPTGAHGEPRPLAVEMQWRGFWSTAGTATLSLRRAPASPDRPGQARRKRIPFNCPVERRAAREPSSGRLPGVDSVTGVYQDLCAKRRDEIYPSPLLTAISDNAVPSNICPRRSELNLINRGYRFSPAAGGTSRRTSRLSFNPLAETP